MEEEYKYFTGMKTGDPKRYDGFSFGTKIFLIPLEDYLLHLETFFFFMRIRSTLIYVKYVDWLTSNRGSALESAASIPA